MGKNMGRTWRPEPRDGGGLKPSAARLVGLVNTDDPAFSAIADLLIEMVQSGVEIDEAAVHMAIKIGRQRSAESRARERDRRSAATSLRLWPEEADQPSIVYYARRGELVKIGTTTRPEERFSGLMPDEVLAWEPGGRQEEALRHRQFRELRVSGEYFRLTTALRKHCGRLREQHGDPDPAWRTTASSVKVGRHSVLGNLPAPVSTDLVTATQAARMLEINKNTIASWVFRKILKPTCRDARSRPLYFLDHIKHLKAQSPVYKETA